MAIDQGSGFRPTGKGYYNKIPNLPATFKTGNAFLHNRFLPENHPYHRIWLFVTSVETGWNIEGEFGQSFGNRTFYPQHLIQEPITITGIMPNQFEYDRLVAFVSKHHNVSLKYHDTSRPVDFKLFPYQVPIGKNQDGSIKHRTIHSGWRYEGYIQKIEAGHERFINAPQFTLQLMISEDFLQRQDANTAAIEEFKLREYLDAIGPFVGNPSSIQSSENLSNLLLEEALQLGEVIDTVGDAFSDIWDTARNVFGSSEDTHSARGQSLSQAKQIRRSINDGST